VADGCQVSPEGEADCDGLDNDCDGEVDEACPCTLGAVQPCFLGPPGRAHTGACSYGSQVCSGGEFPSFGPCRGGVSPSAEACDGLDNDCNGCSDDIAECVPVVDCPKAGDPRIPVARPFQTVTLDARAFVDAAQITSAHWAVEGSPCDALFAAIPGSPASAENGLLSYQVTGAATLTPSLRVSLSGSYAVSLALGLRDGSTVRCAFPMQVRAEGLRVELCWDATGPTAGANPVDLDLHLAKRGATASFGDARDCDYRSCVPQDLTSRGIWGHPNTDDVTRCATGGPLDFIHELRGNCQNPRLDLDNQGETSRYVPENINLDVPAPGEEFEVAVNHRSLSARRTRALVNVYCGGALSGSFSLAERDAFSDLPGKDEYWRVANVAMAAPDAGGAARCVVSPLTSSTVPHAPDLANGDFSLRFVP